MTSIERQQYWQQQVADKQCDTAVSGRIRYMRLGPLSATPVQRHAKIKGGYNPFDPAWEREGEILRTRRMMNLLQYRKEIVRIYQQQRGQCVHCRLPIARESGWHDHYLLPRIQGGKGTTNNRVSCILTVTIKSITSVFPSANQSAKRV